MINQAAIKKFLGRQLPDYDWLKGSPHFDLDQGFLSYKPPVNQAGLWAQQKVLLLLALELKRFMFLLDMGGGKTLVILRLLEYRKLCGEKRKAIVFVPYLTSVDTWVEEVNKHAPSLICKPLLGTTAENFAALGEDADLHVICYQSAVAMLNDKVGGEWVGGEWKLNSGGVREEFAAFSVAVFDEVHKCKSHRSLTYQMCRAISAQCEYVFGLTGTPFGRNMEDLWPQFNLIDFGETLGPTLGLFRGAFFKQKINYWGGYEYTFKPKMLPDLKRMIKNRSISYTIDELHDLPPKDYITRHLAIPLDIAAYSKRAIEELNKAVDAGQVMLIKSAYLQLRQLSSGFMTFKGEDDEKLQVGFDENPKLDALEAIIDAAPADAKIIIFHHFVYTSGLIAARLRALKLGHVCINGTVRDPVERLRHFKTDPKVRILVINTKSGSSSLNLQLANYVIFFEQPDSPIDRKQAEARVWRPGQDKRVLIYDLLVRGTGDVTLHKANLQGKYLLDQLLSGKVKL